MDGHRLLQIAVVLQLLHGGKTACDANVGISLAKTPSPVTRLLSVADRLYLVRLVRLVKLATLILRSV